MARASYKVAKHRKNKRILKAAKGFRGGRSKLLRSAKETLKRSLAFSFMHRRKRKGDFRRLWIVRINAACKSRGMNYSRFMNGLKKANIELDRKQLSHLAIDSPQTFDQLVESAKAAV